MWVVFFKKPEFFSTLIGEDRNKDLLKNWQLCGVWKLPFCDHREIKVTQNCVCFTNPNINLFVLPNVTGEWCHVNSRLSELLHLLQCIAAYLQCTLPWVSGKTQYLGLFSADFHSDSAARSRKLVKCTLKSLIRGHKAALLQFPTGKASSQSNEVVVYPRLWRRTVTHPAGNGCDFTSSDTDTNFSEQECNKLTASRQRCALEHLPQFFSSVPTERHFEDDTTDIFDMHQSECCTGGESAVCPDRESNPANQV